MSHDQGRPSLFAGMEDGASPGSDTQRVRILSTLESTRRPQRPARKGPPSKGAEQPWAARAWAITLGLGVVTLLISFVLIIQSQRPAPIKPASLAQATPAVVPVMPTLPMETPSAPMTEAPAVATNEALESLPPTAASSVPQDASRDPLAALGSTAVAPAASEPKVADVQPSTSKGTTTAAKSTKPAKPVTSTKTKGGRNDQDVELIEAVMSHAASSRPGSR